MDVFTRSLWLESKQSGLFDVLLLNGVHHRAECSLHVLRIGGRGVVREHGPGGQTFEVHLDEGGRTVGIVLRSSVLGHEVVQLSIGEQNLLTKQIVFVEEQ